MKAVKQSIDQQTERSGRCEQSINRLSDQNNRNNSVRVQVLWVNVKVLKTNETAIAPSSPPTHSTIPIHRRYRFTIERLTNPNNQFQSTCGHCTERLYRYSHRTDGLVIDQMCHKESDICLCFGRLLGSLLLTGGLLLSFGGLLLGASLLLGGRLLLSTGLLLGGSLLLWLSGPSLSPS